MEPLILIGGGGHAVSCIDVIESQGLYSVEGIVDGGIPKGEKVLGYPILGGDEILPELLASVTTKVCITVGQIKSPAIRQRLFFDLHKRNAEFPVIVSPSAHVSNHSVLGMGTIVLHGAVVNAHARVGIGGIINTGAIIEHDARVGDFCHVSTGAIINGASSIGDGSFVGSRAVLFQGITVARDSIIPAGMVVRKSVLTGGIFKG